MLLNQYCFPGILRGTASVFAVIPNINRWLHYTTDLPGSAHPTITLSTWVYNLVVLTSLCLSALNRTNAAALPANAWRNRGVTCVAPLGTSDPKAIPDAGTADGDIGARNAWPQTFQVRE